MQPPFSRWYNPNKRCDVMVGSSAISIEQLQESSPEVGEQKTRGICEGACHRSFCRQNILRMTSDRNCLAKQRYCQRGWSKKGLNCQSFLLWILPSCILFWGHISSLNETCLSFVFLLFWNQEMLLSKGILTKYVWSNSNMQSLIMNIKSVLIAEMTWCLKMTWGDQTILNSYLLKLNHTSYS